MTLAGRAVKATDRFYDRIRHPDAARAARAGAGAQGFGALRGHKYCLLVTYRRSGEPVPTPVWFGLDDTGEALYVRTEADAGKVKRIRANPRVLVGPASARGKPTAPLAEGRGRVLAGEEQPRAERVLQSNYGLGRRLYEGLSGPLGVDTVYLEVTSHVA
jgi:uncharacterized protein